MDDPIINVEHKPFSVAGKVALVTGASSGIGRAMAARLAYEGCSVILAARRVEKLQQVRKDIESLPEGNRGKVDIVPLDVSGSESEIDKAVATSWEKFGGIDILINNAGVNERHSQHHVETSIEWPQEEWEHVLNTNIRGLGLVLSAVTKRMISEGRRGAVVNVSSVGGTGRMVVAGASAIYQASKAAVIQLTRALALELGPKGIRVNAIAPGLFPTEMTGSFYDMVKDRAHETVPLQRWGHCDPDLTAPLLLLASDSGSYMTGVTLIVDGGFSLGRKSII